MRKPYILFLIISIIGLVSCGISQLNSNSINHPNAKTGFAIYLLASDSRPQQLPLLSHLVLEQDPLLAADDIMYYHKATHEIELTTTGYEIIHNLQVPVHGKAFAICIDGQPIYTGAFWADYSSVSYDGIIINTTQVIKGNPVIQVSLGYPDSTYFHGTDPRSDPRIFQALEAVGKLK